MKDKNFLHFITIISKFFIKLHTKYWLIKDYNLNYYSIIIANMTAINIPTQQYTIIDIILGNHYTILIIVIIRVKYKKWVDI